MKNFFVCLLLFCTILPVSVLAAQSQTIEIKEGGFTLLGQGASQMGTAAGLNSSASLPQIVANVIKFVLALLGMVMMVIVVYAGFLWMTAGGADEKVLTAKKYLKNGLIGLVLIFTAYAISDFAISNISNIVNQN